MGLAAASQKRPPAIGDIQPLHGSTARASAPSMHRFTESRYLRACTDSLRTVIWLTRARYHNRCGYASVKPERARYCEADTTRRRLVAEKRHAPLISPRARLRSAMRRARSFREVPGGQLNSNSSARRTAIGCRLGFRRLFCRAERRVFRPQAPGSSRVAARELRSSLGRRLFRARLGAVACLRRSSR
jgi:hypothetical protein